MILCVSVTIGLVISYAEDKKVEKAVHEELEKKVGHNHFTIKFIKEMKDEEDHISVSYYIDGDERYYWGWYIWEDGMLVHDFTRSYKKR